MLIFHHWILYQMQAKSWSDFYAKQYRKIKESIDLKKI